MKLTSLLLFTVCLTAAAAGHTQTVTLNLKNEPLETVFKEIRKQTHYNFLFSSTELKQLGNVSVQVSQATVEQVLDVCFKGKPFTYTIESNNIIVRKSEGEAAHDLHEIVQFKLIDVHGQVTNEAGDPVVATVIVKGTNRGTATNDKGYFELKGIDENATLLITAVNIEPYEIKVNGKTELSIQVKAKISKLDESLVIAYGSTTQRFNVGAVTKVSAEEISSQPVGNILAALEGRVPGLVVSTTSGLPGASYKIQIRGQNNVNPKLGNGINPLDNPLIIVDGIPLAAQNANLNQLSSIISPGASATYNNVYSGLSGLNSINPADIESIEVLRDADATAIYGSRGANGVILISTKKGKAGKTKLTGNVWSGASKVTRTLPMMNTQEYLQMRREAFKNDGATPTATTAPDLLVYDTTSYTDWRKYLLGGTSRVTDSYLSLTGGSETTQFLLSGGYRRETYITPGDYADNRASFNVNLHHNSPDKRLTMDFSGNYSYDQNNTAGNPSLLTVFTLPPDYPALVNADGTLNWNYKGTNLAINPVAYLKQKYLAQTYNLISHLQIGYQIARGLTLKTSLGYNTISVRENRQTPLISINPTRPQVSESVFGRNDFQNWIVEPQVEYAKNLWKGRLTVLAGATFQQRKNTANTITASGYPNDGLLNSISSATSFLMSDANSDYRYGAGFGRINYIVSNRYIINLSGRRDGSSRFGPGKQFGNFGSVGTGWILSEEKFIKGLISPLSYAKLRASYGTTGNDAIGDYQFLANWRSSGRNYQNIPGYVPANLANPEYSWATNKKLEVGLELGFLNNRILLNTIWYQNRCGNQLVQYSLPIQTGFVGVTANFDALVENKGWEIQLNSQNIKGKRLSWNTSFNITIPKNTLLSFPGIESSSYKNVYIVGQSLNVLNKFLSLGLNDTTGLYQFLTIKGVPTYSPQNYIDYQVIGNADPKFYGGLRNSISYRGFTVDLFLEFRKQIGTNYLYNVSKLQAPGTNVNLPALYLSRWQKPGDHSDIQKLTSKNFGTAANTSLTNASNSELAYSDASYIRFKTLSLSYTIPASFSKKLKLSDCKLYASTQNLVTITKYKGGDPETQNLYGIPPLKTITLGIQVNL